MRWLLVVLLSVLGACSDPHANDAKVIIGGTLLRGSESSLSHSVIIVRESRIAAVGPQQTIPIPPGSEKTEAYGKFVAADEKGTAIQTGAKADLVVLSADPRTETGPARVERRMKDGRWVQ